jgi:pyruvate formate lyase activating enzyme
MRVNKPNSTYAKPFSPYLGREQMEFSGLLKTSLIDYPDRISTVLFTAGCNLRCPFCYNWRLVLEPQHTFISEENVLRILASRQHYVNSVVITGGEPTINHDLPSFLKKLKKRGFATKLDTNGFFPEVTARALLHLDYIALDVKTCLERYKLLGAKTVSNFLRTIEMLKKGRVDYELRCTVVPGFVDKKAVHKIAKLVKGAKRFVFQQFDPNDTLDKSFKNVKPYSQETIAHFTEILTRNVGKVILRI